MDIRDMKYTYQKEHAKFVLDQPIDPREIKERDGGFGKKLKYVDGPYVIKKLNEAFGDEWDFYVVNKEIIPSVPKPVTEYKNGKRVPKLDENGKQVAEEQPPYVEILGRLVVPGIGVKEQFGTKVLLGGASEQEGAAKAAATDALKKCATMLGIGLELYSDDDIKPEQPSYNNNSYNSKPKSSSSNSGNSGGSDTYKQEDVTRLKELKVILVIDTNEKLNPYAVEFLSDKSATYRSINPSNIAAFNVFLTKKAEEV